MSSEDLLKRWIIIINEIRVMAQNDLTNLEIFRGYIEIVSNNPTIQNPRDFHDWARSNYGNSLAMSIRRQLDPSKDAISIMRLLLEIIEHPEVITKAWHRSVYSSSDKSQADQDFQNVAGTGDYFDKRIAGIDIKKLKVLGSHINSYATDRIAHSLLGKPLGQVPNFNDLQKFLEEFDGIINKYVLLFTGSGYGTQTPTWQYDWTTIFEHKWKL